MRRIITILLLIIVNSQFSILNSQTIGEWKLYPSYMIATQNATIGSRVYGLMSGNLLCYDTEDQSVETYNRLEHLNDVKISHIEACKQARTLVIVYSNGNIDMMDVEGNVWNLPGLKNSTESNKKVNGLCVEGTTAYLCTNFGFMKLDVRQHIIADTYYLNQAITGVKVQGDYIYASTDKNVLRCPLSENWKTISNWTTTTELSVNDVKYAPTEYNQAGGLFWHSDGVKGLNGYKKNADGSYTLASGPIQPNSPIRDLFYRMNYVGDRLLVAGGINTPNSIYYPATAMMYEDGKWSYFDEITPKEQYPDIRHYNTTHVVQDPIDDTHHYASPYRYGVYEYKDGKFVTLYNHFNSPIQTIPGQRPLGNYDPAVALQFDGEGNLWMANQETDTIVRVLTPEKKWYALYYEEIDCTPTVYDYLFSSSGVNFLISNRISGRGFFGFTTGGTLNTTRDDRHKLRTEFKNEDGTSYKPDRFYCMTEDLDGQIWCGTNLGLFIIEDPTKFFDDDFTFLQIKLARNDGSGLADYLLSGVDITCIAVDYANRKWIGTGSNGIFLLSDDGQETIHHFTTDNSPLISNNIQCIAVNNTTGEVMIGTDMGLCSYMGDAIEAEETLKYSNVKAYPNPVTPDWNGSVTIDGLTNNAEVKICSSTGQLINSGRSNGGRFTWNCQTKGGRRVSSGVYNVIANTEDGKKAIVTRIVVIK